MGFVWNRTIPIAELLLLLLLCMQSVLDCVPVHSDFSHTALASPPTKCVSIVFISSASLLHILIFIGGFYAGNHHDDVSPMQMTAPNNSECYSLHIELYTEPLFCVVWGFFAFSIALYNICGWKSKVLSKCNSFMNTSTNSECF